MVWRRQRRLWRHNARAGMCMRRACGVQSFRFVPRPNIVFPSPDNYNHRAVFRRAAVDSFFPAVPINLKRPLRSPFCASRPEAEWFVRLFVFTRCSHAGGQAGGHHRHSRVRERMRGPTNERTGQLRQRSSFASWAVIKRSETIVPPCKKTVKQICW